VSASSRDCSSVQFAAKELELGADGLCCVLVLIEIVISPPSVATQLVAVNIFCNEKLPVWSFADINQHWL